MIRQLKQKIAIDRAKMRLRLLLPAKQARVLRATLDKDIEVGSCVCVRARARVCVCVCVCACIFLAP